MRQAILLIVTALLFFSCKQKFNSVQDVMSAIAPEEQRSTIDPTIDNVIKGEKGTQIFIPANAFVLEDGSLPKGKVSVLIKEFYSASDFISDGLSSVSDGDLLETGGMLFITAKSEENKLNLSKAQSLTVAFPKQSSAKMETFYGDSSSGSVSWAPAFGRGWEGDYMGGVDTTLVDSSMYRIGPQICGHVGAYTINGSYVQVEWKLKHPDSTIFLYVKKHFSIDDTAIFSALCKQDLRVRMDLSINTTGKVTKVIFTNDRDPEVEIPVKIQRAVSVFMKSLPPFDMNYMMTYDRNKTFYLCIYCPKILDWEEYDKRFKQKYTKYLDKTVEQMGKEALNYHIMSAGRLGWINCDRFLYDTTEKIDYIVKVPERNDSKVMIIFENIKSIMNGEIKNNQAVFKNIPVSSKIKVIGISYRDGKPLLSKMPAVVTKEPFTLSGFKGFTLKELEKELNN